VTRKTYKMSQLEFVLLEIQYFGWNLFSVNSHLTTCISSDYMNSEYYNFV